MQKLNTHILKTENSKLPIHFLMIGFVLLIVGVIFLISFDWKALLIVPGLAITFVSSTNILNLKDSSKIEETSIFRVVFIRRKSEIPKPEYIVLRSISYSQRQNVLSISRTDTIQKYCVNFVCPDNKIYTVYSGGIEKAKEISQKCADYYGVVLKNRIGAVS